MLKKYEALIRALDEEQLRTGRWPKELEISAAGRLSIWYSPFDHVNTSAKVVLLGITPGQQQASNALRAARDSLAKGDSIEQALQTAKSYASFSGPMRKNLVSMLDDVGLNRLLGIPSCDTLWSTNGHLVHFTSVLRYPVFKDGANYSGTPRISTSEFLTAAALEWTGQELARIPNAWLIPLGSSVEDGLNVMLEAGLIDDDKVLRGLPHPSGANMERIKYFLGQKARGDLSTKVDADSLDKAKERLLKKLSAQNVKTVNPKTEQGRVERRITMKKQYGSVENRSPFYVISRGKNAGKRLYPHVHEDGAFVVSPTRFEEDYIRVASLSEALDLMQKRRLKLRMSNPRAGIKAPSLIRLDSLQFEATDV